MGEAGNVGRYYTGILVIGAIQLFVFIATLAVGIANAVICGFLGSIGYGIWGAALCLVAGIMGIIASQKRSTSAIVAHLVFAILAAVSAAVQLAMGINAGVVDYWGQKRLFWNAADAQASSQFRYFTSIYGGCSDTQRGSYVTDGNGPTTTDALLASFAIMQGVLAIIASTFSCRAAFCPPGIDHYPWQGSQQHLVRKVDT